MKILKNAGTFKILNKTDNVIELIAEAARTCYQSNDKASPENDIKLVKNIITRGQSEMVAFSVLYWSYIKSSRSEKKQAMLQPV